MKRNGLTLIELMVTACILAIGIVAVIRSFISTAAALDDTHIRIRALRIMEARMNGLEIKAREEGGLKPGSSEDTIKIDKRNAVVRIEVAPIDVEALKDEINEARIRLSWSEGGKGKDAQLGAYFQNKK